MLCIVVGFNYSSELSVKGSEYFCTFLGVSNKVLYQNNQRIWIKLSEPICVVLAISTTSRNDMSDVILLVKNRKKLRKSPLDSP